MFVLTHLRSTGGDYSRSHFRVSRHPEARSEASGCADAPPAAKLKTPGADPRVVQIVADRILRESFDDDRGRHRMRPPVDQIRAAAKEQSTIPRRLVMNLPRILEQAPTVLGTASLAHQVGDRGPHRPIV